MSSRPDLFGAGADAYFRFRPRYPEALFDSIAERAPGRSLACDVATGSGQAALALGERFVRVVALDASLRQLARAEAFPGVHYLGARAEALPLASRRVDVVTVGQALHWLELDTFYAEVRRLLRPAGLLAVWTYGLPTVTPSVDSLIRHLHGEVLRAYWPRGRRHVDQAYASLAFPFERLDTPLFQMSAHWTLDGLLGYLGSWSSVLRYRAEQGESPVARLEARWLRAWGEEEFREVRWPLTVWIGRAGD